MKVQIEEVQQEQKVEVVIEVNFPQILLLLKTILKKIHQ